VDEVEVQIVDTEASEALLGLFSRVAAGRMKLRRDEDLGARHATLLESPTDACLVAVPLRRVDVSIAELECPSNRVDALRPVGNLPETETKRGNLTAVREYSNAVCLCFRCVRQRSSFVGESHWVRVVHVVEVVNTAPGRRDSSTPPSRRPPLTIG
jgi:hypothetical protein